MQKQMPQDKQSNGEQHEALTRGAAIVAVFLVAYGVIKLSGYRRPSNVSKPPAPLNIEGPSAIKQEPAVAVPMVHSSWLDEQKYMIKAAVNAWLDDYAPSMGAALSYYTLFSLAPLLLIVIAVAGMVFGRDAAQGAVLTQLSGIMGAEGRSPLRAC